MKFEIIAQCRNGNREVLDQPEFIGEGVDTLAEAIAAAADAMDYADGRIEYCDIYCDENTRSSNGYCGYVDQDGWHRDCDCTID